MKKILVIGSLNADMVVEVDHLPVPGETKTCNSFEVLPGGKGMNQAVCAAKLGADVTMAGCIGEDHYGTMLLQVLKENGIRCDLVHTIPNVSTGMAVVTTSTEDNSIIVIPGANAKVDCEYIDSIAEDMKQMDMVVVQLEIPIKTVYYIIDRCNELGIPVLFNPAPAADIKDGIIDKVTYFTPNETELSAIYHDTKEAVLQKYPNKIIMSAGKDGAYYHDGNRLMHCKARTVSVVDTTGAGDAFNGALAFAVLEGKPLEDAVDYANGIAAITTTVKGAQGVKAYR